MILSNISIVVNSKLGLLRDNTELEITCLEGWLNSIVYQSKQESLIRKDRCEICNSKEDDFEGHHIAGRKHDWRQITACIFCHAELSLLQKLRDERWSKHNQSESLKESFFLYGLYDILILKSKKTGNSFYTKYANLFVEDISKRLKSK